jgi:hypothetical protein
MQLASNLRLPEEAITETFAFLGRRGSGKSYGALKLAEQFLTFGAQIVAIDPIGIWWSLRVGADGKQPGFDIPIFGGLRADIPLEPSGGRLVADLVVDRSLPIVLDVSLFHKADRKRFVTDFAVQLFHRKKTHKSPLHLFLEEAQVFVPQRIMKGEEHMLGAFEDLIKLGRNFGIGVTLISQRPQAVNKDALNQTEALVVMQTNGAQERKALESWITEQGVQSREVVNDLPSLPVGTAWFWSPGWLRTLEKVKIERRTTFDASATPRMGKATVTAPRPLSSDELALVSKEMAMTIERAKANDPKALRAEIASLQAKLAAKAPLPRVERVEVPVEVPVVPKGLISALQSVLGDVQRCITAATTDLGTWKPTAKAGGADHSQPPPVPNIRGIRTITAQPAVPPRPPRTPSASANTPALTKAERLILTALVQHVGGATKQKVAILTGYAVSGGGFGNAVSALNSRGYIERNGAGLQVTPAGVSALGPVDPLPTGDALLDYWHGQLTKAESAALRAIADAYPASISKERVAQHAGYEVTGGGFNNALSRLRTLQLIEGRSELRASEALFS